MKTRQCQPRFMRSCETSQDVLLEKCRSFTLLSLSACIAALLVGCTTGTPHQPVSDGLTASSAIPAATTPQGQASVTPLKSDLPIPDHPSIDNWVRRFSEDKHKSFQVQLDRARFYVAPSQEVFAARGLPKDLVYVALIESGFVPKARSHANAVGMWQFISSTGKRFGLEQNEWVDERCHPFKAARAAADYLSFLYDTFGSWPLALAAYNAGEKAVQDNLDNSGLKTFWDLADTGYLPAETRDYVPKVYAAIKIVSNPAQYGFHFDPAYHVTVNEPVSVPGGVRLSWLEKQIGVPEDSLKSCNPELCKPVTPPWCPSYELCVPVGKSDDVLAALAEGPPPIEPVRSRTLTRSSDVVVSYKTRPGDTWSSLARKYKCSARALAALNGTSTSLPLKAWQTIKLPAGKLTLAKADRRPPKQESKKDYTTSRQKNQPAASTPQSAKKSTRQAKKTTESVRYSIRQGDTLSSIAAKHNVSVKELCAQNRIRETEKLVPGEFLVIDSPRQEVQSTDAKNSKQKKRTPQQRSAPPAQSGKGGKSSKNYSKL